MKAIILAGGEGTRLRPLTRSLPKPMVELFDKPVLQHIIELLRSNGFDELCATLGYKPDTIIERFGDSLRCVIEETPLGTAGSVKNCSDFIGDDDFLIISGDAICDFPLRSAFEYHKNMSAAVTVITFRHPEPLAYGLVQTDNDGRIIRFFEKPNWRQVFTDRVNTGIYIINPRVLKYIPDNQKFDFSRDLFPELLRSGEPMYACQCDGNWCDIGDCGELLRCATESLNGEFKLNIPAKQTAPGIWSAIEIPKNVTINPPVYIGEGVSIGGGAVIGPNAVISKKSNIGRLVRLSDCMILSSEIADKSEYNNCILTAGNEKIDLSIPDDTLDLTPESLITLGRSFTEAAVGCDCSKSGAMAAELISAGIRSGAGHCITHDAAFLTQANFAARITSAPVSIFCETRGGALRINITGKDCAPLAHIPPAPPSKPVGEHDAGAATRLSAVDELHIAASKRWTLRQSLKASIMGDSEAAHFARRLLTVLNIEITSPTAGVPRFFIDNRGSLLSITDERGYTVREPRIWLLLTRCLVEDGQRNFYVPYHAPAGIDVIAHDLNTAVYRTGDSRLIPLPLLDGAAAAAIILHTMSHIGRSLNTFLSRIPELVSVSAQIPIKSSRARMMDALSCSIQSEPTAAQGAEFRNEKGVVRVRPSASSQELRIYAEASRAEIAAELCEDFERRIKLLDSSDGK